MDEAQLLLSVASEDIPEADKIRTAVKARLISKYLCPTFISIYHLNLNCRIYGT